MGVYLHSTGASAKLLSLVNLSNYLTQL